MPKTNIVEKAETRLTLPHEEFLAMLKIQINQGLALLETQVVIYESRNPFRGDGRERPVDEAGYERFHTEYGKWHGFNTELLKRSFTNQGGEYLKKYNDCGGTLLYSNLNKVDFLKALIKEHIDELQTIETQLPFHGAVKRRQTS